jgi:hypothetical protein
MIYDQADSTMKEVATIHGCVIHCSRSFHPQSESHQDLKEIAAKIAKEAAQMA